MLRYRREVDVLSLALLSFAAERLHYAIKICFCDSMILIFESSQAASILAREVMNEGWVCLSESSYVQ